MLNLNAPDGGNEGVPKRPTSDETTPDTPFAEKLAAWAFGWVAFAVVLAVAAEIFRSMFGEWTIVSFLLYLVTLSVSWLLIHRKFGKYSWNKGKLAKRQFESSYPSVQK